MLHGLTMKSMDEIKVFCIKTCTYFVYFKSKKELIYNIFVDLNILGAARLVHSDLRIYRILFFPLDWIMWIRVEIGTA